MSIYDLDKIAGRVTFRCDFNGAVMNGKIISTRRVDAALESIKYVLSLPGEKQLFLVSHGGRFKDIAKNESAAAYSLAPLTDYLKNKLGVEVDFADWVGGRLFSNKPVVLMQNTRYCAWDERTDNPAAASRYAEQLFYRLSPNYYIVDGFSVGHRNQPSVTGIAEEAKRHNVPVLAGALLLKEYEFFIDKIIKNPVGPFLVFLGGAKVSGKAGKLPILEALLRSSTVDRIVIGGAMAFPFMLEKFGDKVAGLDPFGGREGRAVELEADKKIAAGLLRDFGSKIIIPTQVVGQHKGVVVDIETEAIPGDLVIKDLKITKHLAQLSLVGYRTIFSNGPFGAYEAELGGHVAGTHEVLLFMSDQTARGATTVIGGGDTMTALDGLKEEFAVAYSHETTGGGASGELLALGLQGREGEFPGIACLTDRKI
jgi:3-phosphoglycerate kinase